MESFAITNDAVKRARRKDREIFRWRAVLAGMRSLDLSCKQVQACPRGAKGGLEHYLHTLNCFSLYTRQSACAHKTTDVSSLRLYDGWIRHTGHVVTLLPQPFSDWGVLASSVGRFRALHFN